MTQPVNGMPGTAGRNSTGSQPVASNPTYNGNYAAAGFNPFAPMQMKTLVYSPEVRIVIETQNGTQYDVSRDIIRGTIVRKENSVSSLFVTLANKPAQKGGGPRYNTLFDRMDKIICYCKRTEWVTVFTGYLDSVPFAQMYAGMCEIKASCTLKRLIHTWWNPALPESMKFFSSFGFAGGNYGVNGTMQSAAGISADAGLGNMLADILNEVGGWSAQDILIQNFPMQFLTFLETNYQQIEQKNQQQVLQFRQMLLGGDDVSGGAGYGGASYQSPVGTAASLPGPTGTGQPFYLSEIVAATDQRSMGPSAQNLATAQDLTKIGQLGAAAGTRDAPAWQALQSFPGQVNQVTAQTSDAAILAVACAMAMTGMMNFANMNVPNSLNYPNDGPNPTALGNGCGLFQLVPSEGWGTVANEMNPRLAAGMFLDHLSSIDWRNMDPAAAIAGVQSRFPSTFYQPFVAAATAAVLAYRQAQSGAGSTTGLGGMATGGATGLPAIGGVGLGAVSGAATGGLTSPQIPSGLVPVPDASGAIAYGVSHSGAPYLWGAKGPGTFDCSGFVSACYASIGVNVPSFTNAIAAMPGRVYSPALIQPGDLIVSPAMDHVVMATSPGGGTIIECTTPGGVQQRPQYYNLSACTVIHVCGASGNPAAPFNPAATADNNGHPASTPLGTSSTGYTGSATSGVGMGGSSEPIARNLFSYFFDPGAFATRTADLFVGEKAFIDDQPLIQMIQAVCKAGLRNFASAPTGEFVAYYPDWFGLDGKQAVLQLEDIECKDVRVNYSDDPLTTHVYVAGDWTGMGESQGDEGWLDTCGVVTVEDQWLYQRLSSIAPSTTGTIDAGTLLNRFGVRPYATEYTLAGSHALEFLIATHIFMLKWAEQYQTTVQFTWMPELFPGMRINLANHNLQVYVTEVTHTFDFEGGFSTSAQIMAPSASNAAQKVTGNSTSNPGSGAATAAPSGNFVSSM